MITNAFFEGPFLIWLVKTLWCLFEEPKIFKVFADKQFDSLSKLTKEKQVAVLRIIEDESEMFKVKYYQCWICFYLNCEHHDWASSQFFWGQIMLVKEIWKFEEISLYTFKSAVKHQIKKVKLPGTTFNPVMETSCRGQQSHVGIYRFCSHL